MYRCCHRSGRRDRRRPCRADYRHLPAGPDSSGRCEDPGRARTRPARRRAGRSRGRRGGTALHSTRAQVADGRLPARPAQDRHAGADRRPHDRLRRVRAAGRRRAAPALLLSTRAITTPQIACHITETDGRDPRDDPRQPPSRADVFRPDRERRSALLSVDRGQGGALRPARATSDLPRARGPGRSDRLSQRHLDLPAARGAGRDAADHSRAGAGRHAAAGLRDRVRPYRPARTASDPGDPADAGPLHGRADQRDHRVRGGCRARPDRGTERRPRRRRLAGLPSRPRGRLSRRPDRRPGQLGRDRAVPHVHVARRVPAVAAGRQRGPASDAEGLGDRMCRHRAAECFT